MRNNVLVAPACFVFVTLAAGGQAPASRPAQKVDAVKNAEAAVGRAAARRNIQLTEEAKKTLALEVVRQEAASTTPAASEPSAAAIERVLTPVADQARSSAVTADAAQTAVVNDKARQVTVTINQDVAAQFAATNKILTEAARARLLTDLEEQTAGLSRSGLDVTTIRSRNQAFLSAIDSQIGDITITEVTYQQARAAIFDRLVKLTLETEPAGANVTMNNSQIGVTPIAAKRVYPGKSYRFDFQLSGYVPATREFYVAAVPDAQTVAELLAAAGAPASNPTPDGSGSPGPPPPVRSNWMLLAGTIIGIVLLMAAVLFARRRP